MSTEHEYTEGMKKHLRKQRLRKAKKKMRPNTASRGPRQRDWEQFADDEWDSEGFYEDERVMPRGTNQRLKAVEEMAKKAIQKEGEEVEIDESDLPPGTELGVVVEAVGEHCTVRLEGQDLDCTVRRSLLVEETTFTSVVAAGDQVAVLINELGEGVVEKVMPRSGVLSRIHRAGSALRKIIAANVDRVLIVASWQKPAFWPELVDRYLIAAQRSELEAVICVNKIDLVEDQHELEEALKPYRDLGYHVLLTSAETGVGIQPLGELLTGSQTVFAGLSGVGKSSLLSQVEPGLELRALTVGDSGANKNQGRHTTTMASLYPLAEGGAVIDTPGIRTFGLALLEPRDLASFYPEIVEASVNCAFSDCLHTHEPDCGVKEGVSVGEISQVRYDSYTKILDGLG
ncbi:MAG TPA: ribosome small subunit-dependent GTPase A [Anaerolineales bacterium]|nr:ribosome small subunit-dependent GTPase A [Anaerolineales bacterium]